MFEDIEDKPETLNNFLEKLYDYHVKRKEYKRIMSEEHAKLVNKDKSLDPKRFNKAQCDLLLLEREFNAWY